MWLLARTRLSVVLIKQKWKLSTINSHNIGKKLGGSSKMVERESRLGHTPSIHSLASASSAALMVAICGLCLLVFWVRTGDLICSETAIHWAAWINGNGRTLHSLFAVTIDRWIIGLASTISGDKYPQFFPSGLLLNDCRRSGHKQRLDTIFHAGHWNFDFPWSDSPCLINKMHAVLFCVG